MRWIKTILLLIFGWFLFAGIATVFFSKIGFLIIMVIGFIAVMCGGPSNEGQNYV